MGNKVRNVQIGWNRVMKEKIWQTSMDFLLICFELFPSMTIEGPKRFHWQVEKKEDKYVKRTKKRFDQNSLHQSTLDILQIFGFLPLFSENSF